MLTLASIGCGPGVAMSCLRPKMRLTARVRGVFGLEGCLWGVCGVIVVGVSLVFLCTIPSVPKTGRGRYGLADGSSMVAVVTPGDLRQ